MVYNLSNINASGLVPLTQSVNTELMYGHYGNLALLTIFIIIFLGFAAKTRDTKMSFAMTSLFVAVFSIMLRGLNLVPDNTVLVAWVIAGVAGAIHFLIKD